MAKLDVFDTRKNKVGEIELSDAVFHAEVKEHLFWEAVKWQQAEQRLGTVNTRTRSEISGSTRKLFKQKGSGRARRGDIKSPVLRGGGTMHGPKPHSFSYTLPKKVKKAALISALSRRVEEKRLTVLDAFDLPEIKTKQVTGFLKTFALKSALIVDQENKQLHLSGRNIPGVKVLHVAGLNVLDILAHDDLVLTRQAVAAIEGRLKS